MESAPTQLVRPSSGGAGDAWGASGTAVKEILPRFGCAGATRCVKRQEFSSAAPLSCVAQNFRCPYHSAQCRTIRKLPPIPTETTLASDATTDVYAVHGADPEVLAYGMAKYSRSALSLRESLAELNEQKAEKFLNTFYFQYGHRSIADLAHLAFAIEKLSILAATVVVDEPRWDGQERSTRYQDFQKSGYYVPDFGDDDGRAQISIARPSIFFSPNTGNFRRRCSAICRSARPSRRR